MTKSSKQPTTSKTPDFVAYSVLKEPQKPESKGYWHRIGAGWNHEDGNGINIQLDSLPLHFDGKITLRIPAEEK